MKGLKLSKGCLFFLLLLISIKVNAQRNSTFSIYYDLGRYTNSLNETLSNKKNFKPYRLMIQAYIDPKNKGTVDTAVFTKTILKFYPEKNATGILCIDLENQAYKNLFAYDRNDHKFKEAQTAFIWMIERVKFLRPNVEVGIYCLPARVYYASKKTDSTKFDTILAKCDIIFPSLYTMYPDKQIGVARNEKYLNDNVSDALIYGKRLNKKVIPFMWNVIHPSNKQFGGELVSKDEMLKDIMYIKNIKINNTSINGIVWWDPDYKSFFKMVKSPLNDKADKTSKELQSSLFVDYLEPFINK